MNSYPDSVRFLYDLQRMGVKLGLRGVRILLRAINNPHRSIPCVHVAGSNGKGSTSAILASLLTAAGYKTGLYTSPHLIDFRERMRINGEAISKRKVVRWVRVLRPTIDSQQSTFFEATTAMAFGYFAAEKVDVAVIETGLGGRLDATNVVRPLVSVITNISHEHTEILGRSYAKIAREKGGIIKRGVPCVTGVTVPRAVRELRKIAAARSAQLVRPDHVFIHIRRSTIDGSEIDVTIGSETLRRVHFGLAGKFQIQNLRLALTTMNVLRERAGYVVSQKAIRVGLRNVRRFSGLAGRLAVVKQKPMVIADVAHNSDATESLRDALLELGVRKMILVFGVLKDKDYRTMIAHLAPLTKKAILVEPTSERARSAEDLRAEFMKRRIPVRAIPSVKKGMQAALTSAPSTLPRLVTGSHFVVGEALEQMNITV